MSARPRNAKPEPDTVSLSAAAHRLGLSYIQAQRLLFRGDLSGAQVDGRWVVEVESIERYETRQ